MPSLADFRGSCFLGFVQFQSLCFCRGGPVVSVLLVADGVLASLLVEGAFHQDVEEVADGRVVSELAADVDGPEERVRLWILDVGEADQVDGDVPDDALVVERLAHGVGNLGQVDLGETGLWEEAACIDVLFGCEAIDRAE